MFPKFTAWDSRDILGPYQMTWWDPQQSAETSPWGHTEDPKRDPKQDMDLCEFSSTVESSNSDPNPQTQ